MGEECRHTVETHLHGKAGVVWILLYTGHVIGNMIIRLCIRYHKSSTGCNCRNNNVVAHTRERMVFTVVREHVGSIHGHCNSNLHIITIVGDPFVIRYLRAQCRGTIYSTVNVETSTFL